MPNCEVCGEPMPEGEEMFKYHGYSGPCPKPPKVSTIDDLKANVDRLRSQLRDAEKSYNDARIAAHPIQPGHIYVDKRGRRGQIVKLNVVYGEIKPLLRLFKKDGTLGARETVMYSWVGWRPE